MATYDLNQVAGANVLEISKPQMANRFERHYNPKAQAGLAVGDVVFADIDVPDWCRTIVVGKKTDTANADVLTVQSQDAGPTTPPVLPIKTANGVQTGGSSSNAAASSVLMQLYPIGKKIRMMMTIVSSVPNYCDLTVAMYDM